MTSLAHSAAPVPAVKSKSGRDFLDIDRVDAAELKAILAAEFQHQKRRYWVERLTEHGILCGEVREYDEILSDAQIIANQSFEQVETGPATSAIYVRAPFRFNAAAAAPTLPAPALGADTEEVLAEAGLTQAEIESLRQQGVLGTKSWTDTGLS